MKKQKEGEILGMYDNTFNDEDDNDMKEDNILKSTKKRLRRNSDFGCLTFNVEKE